MGADLLLRRIDERLQQLKAADPKSSERRVLMSNGLDLATIRRIRRGQKPAVPILAQLEGALKVAPGYLIETLTERKARQDQPIPLVTIYVIGAVQAGIYKEAIEWNGDEWYSLTVPINDDRFPDIERFGLEVRGNSMNLLYPEGTIVLVVRFNDIGRKPNPGERVVVLRRSKTGGYEATLKEYQRDERGRHILWPRSTDPEFQAPFVLGGAELPVSGGYEPIPAEASAGDLPHAAGEPDIIVTGLIVGSFRRE